LTWRPQERKREQYAAQLRLLAGAWAQCDAAFDELALRQSVQLLSQLDGCGQHERAQLVEAPAADGDRGLAADKQHTQRLAAAAATQLGQRLAGQRHPGSAQRIEGIALGAAAATAAGRPLEFEHPLAPLLKITSKTSSVGTGALDCPDPTLAATARQLERPPIALSVRLDPLLRDQRTQPGVDQRKRVTVAMGIDTDHDVDRLCKHLYHLRTTGDNSGAGLTHRNRTRQVCEKSRHKRRTGF
jgi:hypothetical protein